MSMHCRIDTPTGSISCDFDEALKDAVMAAMEDMVMASGVADLQSDGVTVRVLHLAELNQIPTARAKSLHQLAEEQGVVPVQDIRDLSGPGVEDFDAFLDAIRSLR